MVKDNNIYVKHILDAIADIEKYVTAKTFAEFWEETLIQDGVIRKIEIVGEVARQISDKFKKEHQEIPWRQVVDLRNKLIHEYFGVDLEAIWLVTQKDLPPLNDQLRDVLKQSSLLWNTRGRRYR